MDRAFRDDDREKRVVTSNGDNIGRVRDIEGDRATIERGDDDDSLTDEIKELLGWDDNDETHELHRDHIDRHEDDTFYLRSRR